MAINKNEITKEMLEKAMQCKTAEELIALAKAEGIEVTKAEAEAYLAELTDVELDDKVLKKVAGGGCWNCLDDCGVDTCPCRD
ncbi:Nif11-like leader peptide family RiPP precursor [uncultured Succiniclasticum sp.]|uniref:Nif11-like leader peptide family RiPP precursor n=1 Tax=uncultured Succiniclasticum sp. TaxID=1500547 RepID=UPI0025E89296|nr:Nif11-like leader peptide family RiPP precursor [uncultured Succiniclasticum sp.]